MKQLPPFPDQYWFKFSEKPVQVKSHDPKSNNVASEYIQFLKHLTLKHRIIDIYHRGSSALGISGKGDIEIGIIPEHTSWYEVIVDLANHFKGLGNLDDDYARFNDRVNEYEVEIILMRGYTATLDKKLHTFLLDNPEYLKEYVEVKRKNSFSHRQYQKTKDAFFRKIIGLIPE